MRVRLYRAEQARSGDKKANNFGNVKYQKTLNIRAWRNVCILKL